MRRRAERRIALYELAKTVAVVGLVLIAYNALPEQGETSRTAIVILALLVFLVWFGFVVRNLLLVRRSPFPMLRLGHAVITTLVLLVVDFAFVYLLVFDNDRQAFNVPLDNNAAAYLSMAITSTVGFGDIVPVSHFARDAVMVQMFVNVAVLGAAVKAFSSAVTAPRTKESSSRVTPANTHTQAPADEGPSGADDGSAPGASPESG